MDLQTSLACLVSIINQVGHPRVQKLTFRALVPRQCHWRNSGLCVGSMAQIYHIGPFMGQKLQRPVAKMMRHKQT